MPENDDSTVIAFPDFDRGEDIHPNFTQRLVIPLGELAWTPSPVEGVMIKRIERIGKQSTRLTSLVKFKPGSSFDYHTHTGGEEFLVLAGIFSDQYGDFQTGTYVRNPPGSAHRPFTEAGCTILVKLQQFIPGDSSQSAIHTDNEQWSESGQTGMRTMIKGGKS